MNSNSASLYDNIILIVFWYYKWKDCRHRKILSSSLLLFALLSRTSSGQLEITKSKYHRCKYLCISFLNLVVKDNYWLVLIDRYLVRQPFLLEFYESRYSPRAAVRSILTPLLSKLFSETTPPLNPIQPLLPPRSMQIELLKLHCYWRSSRTGSFLRRLWSR